MRTLYDIFSLVVRTIKEVTNAEIFTEGDNSGAGKGPASR
jgi:hypothetical protein